ncbi:carboxylate-amine ligase [Catenuloplanes nepalensis]|uniref:Putative glutamate--cysteine ligase 2 n=1 Tax=Catenuloplanes nepalensis TaxID=587533 RepID=A0ABT9MPM2_9ACTN|nr:glutamate--cysteine ligase [Catenuloplanes nepalensis]MDP9793348.1 carboxylate-amine ligase [Catenuloplanes nepalensis]
MYDVLPGGLPGVLTAEAVVPTLGVEEEFLLLDPRTGENAPVADRVRADLPEAVREYGRPEFRRSMVEMVTPVCTQLAELSYHLRRHRRAASLAARGAGARLTAIGATPVHEPDLSVPDGERYRRMAERFGAIAREPALCGLHVHVGVPDRELAVQVCAHLRAWLPLIQAMTANSPIFGGADTGHASWRSVRIQRWPSLGPSPVFDSAAEYDAAVAALVESGAMIDSGMVFWYARLSDRYPTVEIRVGDVCATARDAVLVAGLLRALVATIAENAGAAVPAIPDALVHAAHWRAAREGLDGDLFDLRTGRTRPAWDLIEDLVAYVAPALIRHGDVQWVRTALAGLRRSGTGATRQRRLLRVTESLPETLNALARLTVNG